MGARFLSFLDQAPAYSVPVAKRHILVNDVDCGAAEMNSGWFETNGKTTRPIPVGWRKGWQFENVYGWKWYGPPHGLWVDLCVLPYEPSSEQRAEIERRFADAKEPPK